MKSASFARLATVLASTHRMGAVASGLSGDLVASETDFKCTPIDPLTPEVAQMAGIGVFAELLQTFCEESLDILEGDVFLVGEGGTTYKVRAVGEWLWRPTTKYTLAIILEKVK